MSIVELGITIRVDGSGIFDDRHSGWQAATTSWSAFSASTRSVNRVLLLRAGGWRLVEVVFVEDACTTQLLDGFLAGRSFPSVVRAFRRLLDTEAEGLGRHVCSPAEPFDQLAEAGRTGSRRASEEQWDVGP